MKKKILIADTDKQIRSELAAAVDANEDFEVVGLAADGEEALELIQENPPNIIIMDLLLSKYDGLSVLDMSSVIRTGCKVFVTTVFISDYIAAALSARRISALLKKPCPAQCVVDRVRGNLRQEMIPAQERLPSLHQQITKMIHDIGVPADVMGYQYLRKAIQLAVEDFDRIQDMTEHIYMPVAQEDHVTPKRVQSAITRAIEIAWDRGDLHTLQSFFGYTVSNTKGKPTNREFIALLADEVLLSCRNISQNG